MCDNFEISLSEDVLNAIEKYLDLVKPSGELGNARFVRNLFEEMYSRLSSRAAEDGNIEVGELKEFSVVDIPDMKIKRSVIGFQ